MSDHVTLADMLDPAALARPHPSPGPARGPGPRVPQAPATFPGEPEGLCVPPAETAN